MKLRFLHQAMLVAILLCQLSICLAGERPDPNDPNRFLDAVREFADNVLKYGRDTYGPKHTPLFVDGLNIHTHEPVKWKFAGQTWILSDFASHQNLFRTLDGLTTITGDPKYRQAAEEAIEYAFSNLRTSNGLFYWGGHLCYDALRDKPTRTEKNWHELKHHYPYYELMWQVNPHATKQFIESFWSAHILDWKNLDMYRHSDVKITLQKPWDYEYKGGPVPFKSKLEWSYSSPSTAADLYYAAATLSKLSDDKKPLIWSKRLAHRFIETRDPNTGISGSMFIRKEPDPAQSQFGDDFQGHLVLLGMIWPPHPATPKEYFSLLPREFLFEIQLEAVVRPRIIQLLIGEALGEERQEFIQWAREELVAWGKVAYHKESNTFIPMLIDGTSLEGYVYTKNGYFGPKGTIVEPIPVPPMAFWLYALAFRITEDMFLWEMTRNIAKGQGFGDIGASVKDKPQLSMNTNCSNPSAALGFLEIYKKTGKNEYLKMACMIGDNILAHKFHRGFFVPSGDHLYAKFDYIEPLTLLHLDQAVKTRPSSLPAVCPSRSYFECPHDAQEHVEDTIVIYAQTSANKSLRLLNEAAWDGKINMIESLISEGMDVGASSTTALHNAIKRGRLKVVELLVSKGADVNAEDFSSNTPLQSAIRAGHKDIVGLLITHGADINTKNTDGPTPLDIALSRYRMDIAKLLVEEGIDVPIHVAARCGVLAKVKDLIEEGCDVNAKDLSDTTPLYYAVEEDQKDIAEFLIAKGANVNVELKLGLTPLRIAGIRGHREIAELLIAKGAVIKKRQGLLRLVGEDLTSDIHIAACSGDVARLRRFVEEKSDINVKDRFGWSPLFWAASMGRKEAVEFLASNGAYIHVKANMGVTLLHRVAEADKPELIDLFISKGLDVNMADSRGLTPLHVAAQEGNRNVAEILIAKGASLNIKNRNGATPLHLAVSKGHTEIVKLLIDEGADINTENKWGWAPIQSASGNDYHEIAELLRKNDTKE